MVVIANRRDPYVLISSNLKYDGKPSQRNFLRDKLKYCFRKPIRRKPYWKIDIENGVSHFLSLDHPTWLPNQHYDITLSRNAKFRRKLLGIGVKAYWTVLSNAKQIMPDRMDTVELGLHIFSIEIFQQHSFKSILNKNIVLAAKGFKRKIQIQT